MQPFSAKAKGQTGPDFRTTEEKGKYLPPAKLKGYVSGLILDICFEKGE